MGYLHDGQSLLDKNIENGRKFQLRSLTSGYSQALDANTRERKLYDPYAQTGLAAFNQYADASGVNGQEGYDRAEGSFRASPGYEWQVDQATDAVARKASALGALGSGNTMTAITDRASNLADLEYDDYLGRLDNLGKMGFAATGAQADVLSDRADLWTGRGRDLASVHRDATHLRVNTKQHTIDQAAEALKGGMLAGQQAAANRWGLGMNLLNLGAGFAGKFL